MALQETLLLKVGPAIAKAVLKLWLKDRSFASNVSVALVDILGAKTADIMAQRDGKREFEAIGDRVAQSLSPLFERDGASIEEGERTAVALALAETLDKTPLDAEFLVKKDLQPTLLAKHLLDSWPDATRGLSQKGTDLYRRAISETSQRIVDIASQFPSFTERSFGEVLRRENELLDIVKRILEEVSRIRESSQKANLEANAAQFEETYRLAVARNLDNMELQGANLSATSRRYSLSVAYITLSAKTDSNAEGGKEGSVSRSVPAHEALAGASRLLIRGMAGSGKTTLLKWVAVHSASHSFEGPLSDWNDAVPFFVRLRKCANKELPKPEEMPGLVAPAISNTMPQGWVHEQLKSGRGIILVDGLDELREEKREAVEIWIRDLLNAYQDARVLVTARHHAADSGWLSQEGFHEAELQPMEPADIFKFIEHWHAAIEQGLHGTTEKEELAEMKSRMLATVREKRSLRSLATSPLLCAMLCALNRDRKAQLPTDRIRLYDACCEMLVERREIE
ncbi:MAG: NACHT domain-containing protein, partial [Planctomycetota bacterium]|nr:NACHT domain-containing protein [Planctomycetota bacterium]